MAQASKKKTAARNAQTTTSYWVLEARSPDRMLLYSLPDPGDDSWLAGERFETAPKEPVVAKIRTGYERAQLLPYFGTPPIMSNEFYEALRQAGVDNLDVYDAVIRSEDDTIEYKGFKAFNIIGVVSAADLSRTRFSHDNPSRAIDASIESLGIDEKKAKGLLMFRLSEYVGAVIIHDRVKRSLEKKHFPYLEFQEPSEYKS